jgi:hypothetical protein
MEALERIAAEESPRARTVAPWVPPALDAVCARAMAKARSDRYPSVRDLVSDLRGALAEARRDLPGSGTRM